MILVINRSQLNQIHEHGSTAYPEEGAGFLLGEVNGERKYVRSVLELVNSREGDARQNRYLITPQDVLFSEQEAMRRGVDVIGVFHSHPDHPNQPSEFDREWALPWFSYVITNVHSGQAIESRSWALMEDRSGFVEEMLQIVEN